jgi:hypothetical protein
VSNEIADIRAALAELRSAATPADRQAARARVTTLGGQAALTIRDQSERRAFVNSLDADIEDAAGR